MFIKFWCFLWGHKTVVKMATGEQYETEHKLYPEVKIKENYYTLNKLDFCKRCGRAVK